MRWRRPRSRGCSRSRDRVTGSRTRWSARRSTTRWAPRVLALGVCLGEAQRRAGDPVHRQTLLAASNLARDRGDAGALIRAALATAAGSQHASLLLEPERIAVLEAALPFVPESDHRT